MWNIGLLFGLGLSVVHFRRFEIVILDDVIAQQEKIPEVNLTTNAGGKKRHRTLYYV